METISFFREDHQQVIEELETSLTSNHQNTWKALDLGSGSGRDAVFLAQRGWTVTAVDYLPILLEKASALAHRYNCNIETLCLDLEKPHKSISSINNTTTNMNNNDNNNNDNTSNESNTSNILENILPKVHLIHVARYLHRPLFPIIANQIIPGGFVVYHTFMKGVEAFGKPKNPRFILQPDELKTAFPGFTILHYEETTLEDGRPIQFCVAQKPPLSQ